MARRSIGKVLARGALLVLLASAMGGTALAATLHFGNGNGQGNGDGLQYTQKFDPCAHEGRQRLRGQDQGSCGQADMPPPRRDGPRRPGSNAFGLQFDYNDD